MNGRLRRTSTLVAVRIAGGNPILSFDEQKGADIPTQTITRHWWFDKEAKEAAELTQDRYGLSWQVMFVSDRKTEQSITPMLMFVGQQCGRAEEAINFYSSVSTMPRLTPFFAMAKRINRQTTTRRNKSTISGRSCRRSRGQNSAGG